MKKYSFLFILFAATNNMQAQTQAPPDSVVEKYHAGKKWQDKYDPIAGYLHTSSNTDSLFIQKSLELMAYFKKQNDDAGANYIEFIIGTELLSKLDYSTSLNYFLQALSGFKARNDITGVLHTALSISTVYANTKNYIDGIKYLKDGLQLALTTGNKIQKLSFFNNIASGYAEAFMPDSGLVYAQYALNITYELKNDSLLFAPLTTVAENYIAKGDYDLALSFLRKAQQYQRTFRKAEESGYLTWINNDYAQAYLGMKQDDSTIHYAHCSLSYSIPSKDIPQQLRAYEYLYKSYDSLGKQDSSNKYFRLVAALKDSISSTEKIKAIDAANFREMLRQQQVDAEKNAAEEQHRIDIQFVLMTLGIVSFIMLFYLLSQSIIVNERVISFLGILGLLIVFEFINLFIHPLLETKTNHSPILMLGVLVLIASVLIPLHHRMEKWIKEKMTEKNKRIRLAAAKRTIQELEEKLMQNQEKKK